jgi:hypothetical protein
VTVLSVVAVVALVPVLVIVSVVPVGTLFVATVELPVDDEVEITVVFEDVVELA